VDVAQPLVARPLTESNATATEMTA